MEFPQMTRRLRYPPHNRDMEVSDNPDTDIRDRQAMSDTQRQHWLLQTEPFHGARPRQTGRERLPVIEDRRGCGGGGGRWITMESRPLCCHSNYIS